MPPRYACRSLPFLVLGLLALTLHPTPAVDPAPPFLCLACGSRWLADAALNLILFVPVGAAAAACAGAAWAIAGSAATSAAIEALQVLVPGRTPSAADIVFNMAGAAAGVWGVRAATAWSGRARPHSFAVAGRWLAAGAVVLVLGATGYLAGPAFPDSVYYGQWTPRLGHLGHYEGRVLSATVGEIPLPADELDDSRAVRALLTAGSPLRVVAIAGPPPARTAPIFSIHDDRQREVVLLGARGHDLIVRYRLRSAALGLDQPEIRVARALARVAPGDTLRLTAYRDGRDYCVLVQQALECGLGWTVADGWRLLMSGDRLPDWLRAVASAAWLAMLAFPLGFLARSPRERVIAALFLVVVLATAAAVTPLLSPSLPDLLGAASGLALGIAGRRGVGRSGQPPERRLRTSSSRQRSMRS